MRLTEHRKRRQASQAKDLAPRLPGAPRGNVIWSHRIRLIYSPYIEVSRKRWKTVPLSIREVSILYCPAKRPCTINVHLPYGPSVSYIVYEGWRHRRSVWKSQLCEMIAGACYERMHCRVIHIDCLQSSCSFGGLKNICIRNENMKAHNDIQVLSTLVTVPLPRYTSEIPLSSLGARWLDCLRKLQSKRLLWISEIKSIPFQYNIPQAFPCLPSHLNAVFVTCQ